MRERKKVIQEERQQNTVDVINDSSIVYYDGDGDVSGSFQFSPVEVHLTSSNVLPPARNVWTSYMLDSLSPPRRLRKGMPTPQHACVHVQRSLNTGSGHVVLHRTTSDRSFVPGSGGFILQSRVTMDLFTPSWRMLNGLPDPSKEGTLFPLTAPSVQYALDKCRASAIREMSPKWDDGFSLPVFLIELIEMKALLKGLARKAQELFKSLSPSTRKIAETASKGWLSTVYGWLPFIRDMEKTMGRLYNLGKDLRRLKKNSNRLLKYHYARSLSSGDLDVTEQPEERPGVFDSRMFPSEWGFANPVFDVITGRFITTKKAKGMYHATWSYTYTLPDLDWLGELMLELDRFGFGVGPSDFWEIIPFSFVVDWFVKIGNWLERYDKSLVPLIITTHSFVDSIKIEYTSSDEYTVDNVVIQGDTDAQPWSVSQVSLPFKYKEKVYYRFVGFPTIHDPELKAGLPHGVQIINGIALTVVLL